MDVLQFVILPALIVNVIGGTCLMIYRKEVRKNDKQTDG